MTARFPNRSAYALLALGVTIFAIYGSLIPFDFRYRPFADAAVDFMGHMRHPSRRVPRADFLANILLFVPIGFGLMGALLLDRSRHLALPATLLTLSVSVPVSILAEFLQVYAPGRFSSRHDIVAQTIGCVIGTVVWLTAGDALTRWLRAAADRSRTDRLSRALVGYVAVWIFVNLAPFNFTYDLGELARRVRTGRVGLVPFGGYDGFSGRLVWDAFITTVSAIPLGLFGLVGWKGGAYRQRLLAAFVVGAALVSGIEILHIFIRSHSADPADVFFGLVGVCIGLAIGWRLLHLRETLPPHLPLRWETHWALGAIVVWAAVICAYHWGPYDFAVDPETIRRKLGHLSFVPFASYYSGSALAAFNNLLTKLGLSIPIGILSAYVIERRAGMPVRIAWLTAVVALFMLVEAGQLLLPSRIPDPTDVLVGTVGSVGGLLLGRWMQVPSRRHGRTTEPNP